MSSLSNIAVAARFRPLIKREKDLGSGRPSDELTIPESHGQEVQYRDDVFTFESLFFDNAFEITDDAFIGLDLT